MRHLRYVLVILPMMGLVGCGSGSSLPPTENLTPQQTVDTFTKAVKNKQPVVIYKLMPKSLQAKTQELVRTGVSSTDAEIWNKLFAVLKKANSVLSSKKDLIADILAKQDKSYKKPEVVQAIDKFTKVLGNIVNDPSLSDHAKAKNLDVAAFLTRHGKTFSDGMDDLFKFSPDPNGPKSLETAIPTITVTKVDGDTATVEIKSPGMTTASTETMVKEEGKWMPKGSLKEMTKSLNKAIAQIEKNKATDPQTKTMIMGFLDGANGALDEMDKAKTAEDLAKAAGPMVLMGMGMGMGGSPPSMNDQKFEIPKSEKMKK